MNTVTKMVLPDGTTQYYDYNYWGQIEEQGYLDSDNQKYGIVTSTYNTIGELLSSTGEDDSGAVYTYNKFGDVTQVVDDSGTRTFTYDTAGRLTNESGANGNKAYTYDLNGNRTGFSLVQDNQTIQEQTYTYDRLNRLTQVKDANENELASYSYDANSNLTSEVRGTIRTNYTYTCGGQLIEKYNFNLSPYAVISDYDYTYYLDGNIKSENTRTFTYDNLGRLKQESDGIDTISYSYDRFGNRTSMNNSGTVTNYTYDLNNRLLTEISGNKTTFYNYDDKGNLYSKRTDETSSATDLLRVDFFGELKNNADSTVELYFYNGLNRLEEVRKGGITAQYTYNAEGIRTSKTVNGVTTSFYLDGANVIAESLNDTTTNYVRGATGIIHSEILGSSNSRKYYTSDGHGNITNLINTNGSVVKSYTYDAFGVEENIDSSDTNPFRYCGEYYESEINQIYLRARYYSPGLGRFNQQDPIRDNLNWYVYCYNNPIFYKDSFGLAPEDHEKFGKNSPKALILDQLGEAYQLADPQEDKNKIHQLAENFRLTDDTITNVIFMNNSEGAKGFGHNAVLLINQYGQGLFFSFGSSTGLPVGTGETRFAILSKEEVANLKDGNGVIDSVVSNNGKVIDEYGEKLEVYDRFIWFPASKKDGNKMYEKATDIFIDPSFYFILGKYQCDGQAQEILNAGGISYSKDTKPNDTYENLSTNNIAWTNILWEWRNKDE